MLAHACSAGDANRGDLITKYSGYARLGLKFRFQASGRY